VENILLQNAQWPSVAQIKPAEGTAGDPPGGRKTPRAWPLQHVAHRGYVLDWKPAAGAAQQGVVQDGLPLAVVQQVPSPGAPGMARVEDAQHDFVDPHLGGAQAGPGFGEQGYPRLAAA
jgi:hypothetical protein